MLVFAVVYYRLSGVYATIAITVGMIAIIGLMAMFEATLTMPGIAGLVLTVGMAVDANVLIFERIREELRRGRRRARRSRPASTARCTRSWTDTSPR